MNKELCIAIVQNIIAEVKLAYPFMKINRTKVMEYVGYDKTYLYAYQEERLSVHVYSKLVTVLKEVDIDEMVIEWMAESKLDCSLGENKIPVSTEDTLESKLDDVTWPEKSEH